MNDMSATIVAKSDQINAADLIGSPRTVTVKEVRIKAGEEQPVTILIDGDDKAFRPCKGVRRLIVRIWGVDANKYIGQSMTLFCDPSVTWAGKKEGGIRVSHMTGLDERVVEYMRISRAVTKPYEILPLAMPARATAPPDKAAEWAADQIAAVRIAADFDSLADLIGRGGKAMDKLQRERADLFHDVNAAYSARRSELDAGTYSDGDEAMDAE